MRHALAVFRSWFITLVVDVEPGNVGIVCLVGGRRAMVTDIATRSREEVCFLIQQAVYLQTGVLFSDFRVDQAYRTGHSP